MPNVVEFSLFDGSVGWDEILDYNLPFDIDKNNITAVDLWFESNFNYNKDTIFWLQFNPICDAIESNMTDIIPTIFEEFLLNNNIKCEFYVKVDTEWHQLCTARSWGDGKCDLLCKSAKCDYDGGDLPSIMF